MDTELFKMFEEELFDEAKRIVPLVYNNKDLFEANIFKKINLEEEQNKTLNEMKIITEFVDTLDLDNDLFRREV